VKYVSTRGFGETQPVAFSDILLEGLAPDGGLYWPETFPQIDRSARRELRDLYAKAGYPRLAHAILSLYIDDIPSDDLLQICQRAYTAAKFGADDPVPVTDLGGGLRLAHLSNGPTAAFKDLAMQPLAEFFEYELERRDQVLAVLGATSGDTGSSAEFAMLGKSRVKVFMLSPQGRMTPFQRGQMYGLDDPRIINITVPGSFDDCQDLVKAVNSDAAFKAAHSIGSINSINWARLAAQVVYYIAIWLKVSAGDDAPIGYAVPTGNFGNIIAGHVARQMGIPIDQLVLATNENNVLAEFFATGVYRIRSAEETFATSSPSMDISKASNFERFVYDLLDRDSAETKRLFGDVLATTGEIVLGADLVAQAHDRYAFTAGSVTHAERVATIRDLYERTGVLIDPHTADGVKLAQQFAGPNPLVAMETALPIKFARTITEATGQAAPIPARFAGVLETPPHTIDLGPGDGADAVKAIIAAH
jgi:threonine synthase